MTKGFREQLDVLKIKADVALVETALATLQLLASGIEMQGLWAGRTGPAQKMSLEDAETLGANR